MAQNPTDAIVTRLEADWPRWQIWTVPGCRRHNLVCAALG